MTHQRRLATARTWIWFILLATIVGATVSFVAGTLVPPTYSGRSTILVSPTPRDTQLTSGDIEVTRAAAATFSELATTGPVLEGAIRRAGSSLDVVALQKAVTTRVPIGTSLLDITVTSKSPSDAAKLANAIAAELVDYPTSTADGEASWQVNVAIVDPALPPTVPDGIGLGLTTILAAGIAFLIALSLAFLVENLRRNDAERDEPIEGAVGRASPAVR